MSAFFNQVLDVEHRLQVGYLFHDVVQFSVFSNVTELFFEPSLLVLAQVLDVVDIAVTLLEQPFEDYLLVSVGALNGPI